MNWTWQDPTIASLKNIWSRAEKTSKWFKMHIMHHNARKWMSLFWTSSCPQTAQRQILAASRVLSFGEQLPMSRVKKLPAAGETPMWSQRVKGGLCQPAYSWGRRRFFKKNAWKKSGNKTVHSRENVITRVTVIIQNKCSCSNWHTEIEDCTGFHFDV